MPTRLFFILIGATASLALFVLYYWSLSLTSNVGMLHAMTTPVYFWAYVLLTLGTILFFGLDASLLVYRWRKLGPPGARGQTGAGLGALVGLGASACPVCGAVLLSAIGVAGGLTMLPFQGLELKALSLSLMILPVWLIGRDLKNPRCGSSACPELRDPSFSSADRPWLLGLLTAFTVFALIGANVLRAEF